MYDFYILVYSDRDESETNFVAQYAYPAYRKLKFDTILNGGFGGCTFDIPAHETEANHIYRTYTEYHIVILDMYGTRVYEGGINNLSKTFTGVKVKVTGYFAYGKYVYLNFSFTNPTVSDVVVDCVDICPWWDDNTAGIDDTSDIIVESLDYTEEEIKVSDLIAEMLKFGYDVGSSDIRGLYFAVWEHQLCFLTAEPNLKSVVPDWRVFEKDLTPTGTAFTFSSKDVVNKVRASYDLSEDQTTSGKPNEGEEFGPRFTAWFEDKISQDIYGVREGTVDVGEAIESEAENIAQLALNKLSSPAQVETLKINGLIYTNSMGPMPAYYVRAGDVIEAGDMDLILTEASEGTGYQSMNIHRGMVIKTTYTVESNTLSIQIGERSSGFARMLARNAFTAAGAE